MARLPSPRPGASRTVRVVRLPLGDDDIRPTFRRERAALKRGVWPIAGCDEAGRGPLAGPVVAAAVVLDPQRVPRGLDDSKKLDPQTREKLHAKICASAQVAVAIAPPWRIDRDNILRASLWALARAVACLPVRPQLVFVDGRDRIDASCDCQAVISGDAILSSIAAASIVGSRSVTKKPCLRMNLAICSNLSCGSSPFTSRASIDASALSGTMFWDCSPT